VNTNGANIPISKLPPVKRPKRPARELTRIKQADVADVCLGYAHFINKMSGLKKIPPPTPTIPEINPIPAPTGSATRRLGNLETESSGLDRISEIRRNAAKIRTRARSNEQFLL